MLYSEIIAVCSQIHTKHVNVYLLNIKLVVRDQWVTVNRAWGVPRLRMEERSPIWTVAANILNKQSRHLTRGGSQAWGLGEVLTTPHRNN